MHYQTKKNKLIYCHQEIKALKSLVWQFIVHTGYMTDDAGVKSRWKPQKTIDKLII